MDLYVRDTWLPRRSLRSCLDFYRFAAKISLLVNAGEEERHLECLPCSVPATVALGMALAENLVCSLIGTKVPAGSFPSTSSDLAKPCCNCRRDVLGSFVDSASPQT